MTRLYLSHDLIKADIPKTSPGKLGIPATSENPAVPKIKGPAIEYDYYSGEGIPTGPGWEQSPSGAWRRPKGMGGVKTPTKPEETASKTSKPEVTQPMVAYSSMVQNKESPGAYSTDIGDYPKDSKAIDHYKVAQAHGKTGYSEGHEAHKQMARERSKDFGPDEHNELANQLTEQGMPEEALYHAKQAQSLLSSEEKTQPNEVFQDEDKTEVTTKEEPKESAPKTMEEWQKHSDEVDSHNKKVLEAYKIKKQEHRKLREQLHAHRKKKPEAPEPFTQTKPNADDKAANSSYNQAKQAHAKKMNEYRKQLSDWNKEKVSIEKKAELAPEAPSVRNGKLKEKMEKPKEESMEPFVDGEDTLVTPSNPLQHAKVSDHSSRVSKLKETIQSHIDSGELSPEDSDRLQNILESIKPLENQEHVPTKEESSRLRELTKLAGAHGKKPFEEQTEVPQPQMPASSLEHAQVADQAGKVSKLKETIQAHLDSGQLAPEDENKLQNILESLSSLENKEHVPTKEQQAQLKELTKLAGDHGKKPPEGDEQPGQAEPVEPTTTKTPLPQLSHLFERGRVAGQAAGRAAETSETAGSLGAQAITYASQGAVYTGHKLLKEESKADTAQDRADRKNRGSQVGQSSMAEKSFGLFLDLEKAGIGQSSGVVPETGKRTKIKDLSSYDRQPVGVTGESASPDRADVGGKWKHGDDEDSVSSEVDSELKKEEKVEKSIELLKSLNNTIHDLKTIPSPVEMEFLTDVMGFRKSDILKGLVVLKGKDRHRFNEWVIDRLNKSLPSLK